MAEAASWRSWGLVDLGDRCGRGGLRTQVRENLPRRNPERLGYHSLYLLPPRRLGPVLEPGKLGDELLREQVTASGQQLAQLGEGNPAIFKGTPQRQGKRRPATGCIRAELPAPA